MSNACLMALAVFSLPVFAASAPGIHNFDKVDDHVYRGAQPSAEGFEYLARLGVTTIIDLRESGRRSKAEERMVMGDGMKYVNVPMTGFTPPTDREITGLLDTLEDSASGPVFVHCWRGADRTGAVIAAYHIDHDKWDNAHALADAKAHRMSFTQFARQDYIRAFKPRTLDSSAVHLAASAAQDSATKSVPQVPAPKPEAPPATVVSKN